MKRKFDPKDFNYDNQRSDEFVKSWNEFKDSHELEGFLIEIKREDLLNSIKNARALERIVEQIDISEFEDEVNRLQEIVDKSIPMIPTGKHTNRRCGRCDTRVRSGSGSSSRTRDTVCRNCFQVIEWEE